MKTINGRNYKAVYAKGFDVLVDPEKPSMALLIEPREGKKFILPMSLETARDMGVMMLGTLMKVEPALFYELFTNE